MTAWSQSATADPRIIEAVELTRAKAQLATQKAAAAEDAADRAEAAAAASGSGSATEAAASAVAAATAATAAQEAKTSAQAHDASAGAHATAADQAAATSTAAATTATTAAGAAAAHVVNAGAHAGTAGDHAAATHADRLLADESAAVAESAAERAISAAVDMSGYDGPWNALENDPPIVSGVGVHGHWREVTVAGGTVIDGNGPWAAGDKIKFVSGAYIRIPNELASALVEKYIDRIVIPGIGDVDYAAVSTDGRVYSASRVDGRAWAGWEAGLFEPERVVDRIVVPGIGDVVFAAVSPDGRVYSASRTDGRAWTGWESGLFEPERGVDRIVIPGIGDVDYAAVSTDGRVYSASRVDGRAWAGWEAGLFEPERVVDRIVVPGIGDVVFAAVSPDGRVYSASRVDGRAWTGWESGLFEPERGVDRIVIPGIGDVDYAAVSPDGRVYSASRVDGRAWAGWEAGLFEPERVVDRIVVPGIGDVVFAAVSPDGRVYSASRVDGRAWTGWESGLFEPERGVDRIVIPGIGDVDYAAVSPDGRVYSASRVDGRAWAGWEAGLFEPERVVDRIVVPGIGDVAFANVDQIGRVYAATSRGGGFAYNSTADGLTRAAAGAEIYDVVIYGATPAGITAAMRAAQRGLTICIVEPLSEIGGVIAGGLCYTDFPQHGHADKIGGLTGAFFGRMATEYNGSGLRSAFEPKVASRVLREYLIGTGARIIVNSPIDGPSYVVVANGKIEAIRTAAGWIRGRTFIAADYEGDFFAAAGAPYHVGRESESEFGESFAGFRTSWGYVQTGVTPNNLYPVEAHPGLAEGAADGLVQPYSYRLVVTTASDRVPFPEPPGGYDASLMDQFVEMINDRGDIAAFGDIVAVGSGTALPNNKWCINALRLLSIELPGAQHAYPDASWSRRWDIIAAHKRWQMHVLYMLQHDSRLSSGLRANSALYGLAADEWTHNPTPGWPEQLYIRESRRLRGAYIMTQYDLYDSENPLNTDGVRNSSKADSIGKFNYFLDAHSMALYAEGGTIIRATGNSPFGQHDSDLYDIPFSCLHTAPGGGHIRNLVVANCFSASSVAWRSMRMEPVFMFAGEAAGEACALMRETGQSVDQLDVSTIQARLVAHGSII